MDKELIEISKFLSLILRHRPEIIDVKLDAEGWLEIDLLLRNARKIGKKLTLEQVHRTVSENDKQRFALSKDGLRIRANQGHSLRSVRLKLSAQEPPEMLFHGTVPCFLNAIKEQGLIRRSRNHVHLSRNQSTAIKVAQRRGNPVVLEISSRVMFLAGYEFFLSENQVWLTEQVPPEYITFPE